MEMPSAHAVPAASPAVGLVGTRLLDRQHLRHQTLGDRGLERIVLDLFLAEAPRYASDIANATDAKSWRMAVHTLKGVALNLGAFRLAALCKEHEGPALGADPILTRLAVRDLSEMIGTTVTAIRDIQSPDQAI